MKDERNGVSKSEIVKSAKDNQDLFDFVSSLCKEEIMRIKEQREFETVKHGSVTWNVAVLCDSIRGKLRLDISQLKRRINLIDELSNEIDYLKSQLLSGSISVVSKHNIVMNENEVKSLIKHNEWLRVGEFNAIPNLLGSIRSVVGVEDVSRKVIFSESDFDSLVNGIESDLRSRGFELFGELNE